MKTIPLWLTPSQNTVWTIIMTSQDLLVFLFGAFNLFMYDMEQCTIHVYLCLYTDTVMYTDSYTRRGYCDNHDKNDFYCLPHFLKVDHIL